ncbi:MAG: hypothetical protein LBM13_02140 [Candidatus Ancillula sp.]|jgi:hypothetical protein|nr:hypothetical protein [Candidatus Ancillula sp.]
MKNNLSENLDGQQKFKEQNNITNTDLSKTPYYKSIVWGTITICSALAGFFAMISGTFSQTVRQYSGIFAIIVVGIALVLYGVFWSKEK